MALYTVKFYDFNDVQQHEIPQADIIDVEFSAIELESEQPLFRTPQSARIVCKNDEGWLFDNIVKMPKGNVADRNICKYYVKIWAGATLVSSMIIFNEALNASIESVKLQIMCYDFTKLLEIYNDLEFNNTSVHIRRRLYSQTGDSLLGDYLDAIEAELGLSLAKDEAFTALSDSVNYLEFADFNLDEDQEIGKALTSQLNNLNPGDEIVYDATEIFHTSYRLGFRTNDGFSGGNEAHYPSFRIMALTIWKAYQAGTSWQDVRPKFYAHLVVKRVNFYNITCPVITDEVDVDTDWRFKMGNQDLFSISHQIGIDENGEVAESWRYLLQQFNIYNQMMTGIPASGNNGSLSSNGYFAQHNIPFSTDINLPSPVSGSYSYITSGSGAQCFRNIKMRRTGRVVPREFNFPIGSLPYLDCIKSMLYCLNQAIASEPDGTIKLYNRVRDVELDPVTPPADIPNESIQYLSLDIRGRRPYGDIRLSLLYGDFGFLEKRLTYLYKSYNTRRQLYLNTLGLVGIGDLLDIRSVKGEYFGYIVSQKVDYKNETAELVMNLIDRAELKFVVKHAGIPVKNATCSLEVETGMWVSKLTDANGEARFFNLTPKATPYKYEVYKQGYDVNSDNVLINTENQFTENVNLVVSMISNPGINPRDVDDRPTQFSIVTNPGTTAYYTTDGSIPEVGSGTTAKYEKPIYVYTNTTVKAISVMEIDPDAEGTCAGDGASPNSTITWQSGDKFLADWIDQQIVINGSLCRVLEFVSEDEIIVDRQVTGSGLDYKYQRSALSSAVEELLVESDPDLPEPIVRRIYDPDDRDAILVSITHPHPDAVIRYTLDGTEPTSTDAIAADLIELDKDTDLKQLRAKAFIGSAESDSKDYQVDEDVLIREGIVKDDDTVTVEFKLSPSVYMIDIVCLCSMYHIQEDETTNEEAKILLSAHKRFNVAASNLSIGTGGLEISRFFNSWDLTAGTYGKIARYNDDELGVEDDISDTSPLVGITASATVDFSNNTLLQIGITNSLQLSSTMDNMTGHFINYKIYVTMKRHNFTINEVV